MTHGVIMAGGSGTRFWPMSRKTQPKHLLTLSGARSMIQQTVDRIVPLVGEQRVWIVTGADHAAEVRAQLPECPPANIIVEPCRRDTAACIGVAAHIVRSVDPDATMVVMPADHVIEPATRFREDIQLAAELVAADPSRLVTFGVIPNRPATGYGYIQRGDPIAGHGEVFSVRAFKEKPKANLAQKYLQSGEYFWNAGIFVWKADRILQEIRNHQPQLADGLDRIGEAIDSGDTQRGIADQYESLFKISIDYAVMEKAENVVVVQSRFGWDDVGSWGAVARLHDPDENGNTVIGSSVALGTRDCIVVSEQDHLVTTIGTSDLIIVHSGNATLVAAREKEEEVKKLVDLLQQQGKDGYL